ncbi:MAG TPA: hypothetical protein VJA23_03365 [Candidatus Nanoarchaeia archaeon]|nr:hypothetical protein [Candidatus Nanoarchaeia archaeon]
MLKNWKSILSYGTLLWILIFMEVSIIMFIPGLSVLTQNIFHLVILPLLALFCFVKYFKSTTASAKTGFLAGIYFLIIGTVLDLIITIPLFVKDYALFYSSWWLWAGYLEVMIIGTLAGNLKSKPKMKNPGKASLKSTKGKK